MPKTLVKQNQVPALRDSAYQIWLAGLGALSIAEDESGKIFKDRIATVREALDLRKFAATTVTKVGNNLDDGMGTVLNRLGLPTKKEIDALGKRVDRLTKALEQKPAHRTRRTTATKRRTKAKA